MSQSPFPGPIAPESNPAIMPQWFQPSSFPITAISYGVSTTVTTAPVFGVLNNYVVGQLVRLEIPPFYGSGQLSGQLGYVVGIPGVNQFTLNINTSQGYDAFISSPVYGPTPPQAIAVGENSSGQINTGRSGNATYIPGSFQNISPSAGGQV